MSEWRHFLITVLNKDSLGYRLFRCALAIHCNDLTEGMEKHYMEPENREKFHALLPLHVRECGPIVDIDPEILFEVHIVPHEEKMNG